MNNQERRGICQMCLSHSWGGMEGWTVQWAKTFRNRGFPSFGVALRGSRIEDRFLSEGIPTLSINLWGSRYFDPVACYRLRTFLDQNRIRNLLVHKSSDLWLVSPALIGKVEPKVVYFSRMFLKNFSKKNFLHRVVYSRVDRMVALSDTLKQYLEQGLPVTSDKIRVIPNGVDRTRFSPDLFSYDQIRDKMEISKETRVIAVMGKVSPLKGQRELIRAIPGILSRHPNCLFLLAGDTKEHRPYFQEVTALSAELGVAEKIRFLGECENVPEILAASDLFVMPSYEENFGNVLLEALMMGKPCIATNSGGTPDILNGGECGLLVEPRSPEALQDGINRLLDDRPFRSKLAERGRIRALEMYDLDIVTGQVETLLNSI